MITGTTPVSRILREYPETFSIFLSNGFEYPDAETMIREIGEETLLQTVLQIREINPELFRLSGQRGLKGGAGAELRTGGL